MACRPHLKNIVISLGYHDLTHSLDGFYSITFFAGVVFFLLFLASFRIFIPTLRSPFQMPWWAFTFPLDALAVSAMEYYSANKAIDENEEGLETIAWILFAVANIAVVLVYLKWVEALFRKRIFKAE